jgi:hypothetical protein
MLPSQPLTFASIWVAPKTVLLYIIGCFERVE